MEGEVAVGVDGIVAVDEPVADVDVGGLVAAGGLDGADEGGMSVTEDAVVERFLSEALLAVEDDAFAVVALVLEDGGVFLDVAFAAVTAPP